MTVDVKVCARCGGLCRTQAGPVVLLPKPRPVDREGVRPGASYSPELVCPVCGPVAAYKGKDGLRHCGRCRRAL